MLGDYFVLPKKISKDLKVEEAKIHTANFIYLVNHCQEKYRQTNLLATNIRRE